MPPPESVLSAAMTPDRTKAARELLAFYLEAGADALLGEEPVDRLRGGEATPARPAARDAGPRPAPPRAPPQDKGRTFTQGLREEDTPPPTPAPAAPASPDVAATDA